MTAITLYEIAAEHRRMVEALLQTDNDQQTIADTIEAESYPLEVKAQSVAYAIKTLQANAAAIKDAEGAMAARRKAMEAQADRIMNYMKLCMEVAGVNRVECPHFTIKVAKNPAAVQIWDEKQIPAAFWKQPETPPPAPDKEAIKAAIKAGQDVPGAQLVSATRLDVK